tara:strand:- start:497 stop:1798 length:1302 start_codon:yes stop_codon:yes gene_type:complete
MKIKFEKNQIDKILYNISFGIITIIFLSYFIESLTKIPGGNWAYNELFINYSSGFIRRGLLGSIFIKLNDSYGIQPLSFFSSIFIILYSLQIYLYFNILKKFQNFKLLYLLIIFSPALILFTIYDQTVYLVKDIFTNLSILVHVLYLVSKKNNFTIKKYNNFLILIIIPFLFINILNHENQFFFISVHFLLSKYIYESKNSKSNERKYIYYLIPFIPFTILLFNPGDWDKLEIISNSVSKFGVTINDQLAGNINLAIGGFIKWHFMYHDINSFINLFICLILTLFLIFTIFHYFIKKNIFILNNSLKKNYLIYFFPSFFLFIFALDHGRNINLILTHLISFYLVLNINQTKLKIHYNNVINNFFLKNLLLIFLFFYIFLWFLPQGGGYPGIGTFSENSTIINNTLFAELTRIFMIIFNFIDYNIIELPKVIVK